MLYCSVVSMTSKMCLLVNVLHYLHGIISVYVLCGYNISKIRVFEINVPDEIN